MLKELKEFCDDKFVRQNLVQSQMGVVHENAVDYEILFNRKDAAKYLGFKAGTLAVWDCTKRYDLKPIKIGRSVRYKKSVLDMFLLEGMRAE